MYLLHEKTILKVFSKIEFFKQIIINKKQFKELCIFIVELMKMIYQSTLLKNKQN